MLTKNLLITFWLGSFISFFLWYRNLNYDRAVAPFLFVLGLTSLVLYAFLSQGNRSQVCKALLFLATFQFFVFAVGIMFITKGMIQQCAMYVALIALGLCIFVVFYLFHCDTDMSDDGTLLLNGVPISMYLFAFYGLSLGACFILLNCQYKWRSWTSLILLILTGMMLVYYFGDLCLFFTVFPILLGLITWLSCLEKQPNELK